MKHCPGPLDLKTEEVFEPRISHYSGKFKLSIAKSTHIFKGEIHAVFPPIYPNILPEVRQLQRRTYVVRKRQRSLPCIVKDEKDKASDGVCGAPAVSQKVSERVVAVLCDIHPERCQQIRKELLRDARPVDGLGESDEYRMSCVPCIALLELTAPIIELCQTFLWCQRSFISEIIRGAGECINTPDERTHGSRDEPGRNRKILVMSPRHCPAEFKRLTHSGCEVLR